ncbi:MAG: hypothetical protein LBQ84_03035 [Flavobacteriaceae bacterium]|jgi:hypothetical protein|nr:hypothetical protein [Flavobacteriaceae bacterium]
MNLEKLNLQELSVEELVNTEGGGWLRHFWNSLTIKVFGITIKEGYDSYSSGSESGNDLCF